MTDKPQTAEIVHIAKIGRPFGTAGELTLHLFTDRPEEVLAAPGTFPLEDGREISVSKLKQRGQKWTWQVHFPEPKPKDPRGEAAKFTNAIVICSADSLPSREEGEYSHYELVDFEVFDTTGKKIGILVRIERYYEVDTWIVEDAKHEEIQIPAVSEFILEVNQSDKKITIKSGIIVE
ncbi:MAG: 16S rRNA processing protein RimM [Candidatus Lindowbacteria bacterium]|nr:16S rRNA processing protein RimM [Candidatus Lindowbacteria bacterium]